MTLTVGIDARAAVEVPAGRGRFVRELLRALAARDDSARFLCYARTRWDEPLDERFEWRLIERPDPWWHALAARAANRECDVFLSTNSYLTAWMLRVPAVLVMYDMVAFDRAHRPSRRSAIIERLTLAPAVRRARAFLAISQATADDFVARFPGARGRTTVVPLGVSTKLAGDPDPDELARLPEPGFVLAVGTLEPRKNLPRLVAAYRLLDEDVQRRHPIAVVGALGWDTGETLTALQSLGDRAVLLGRVSDAALAELYRRCALLCYPSLYEGFGLPVLEAMAAGAAVVTSNVSSLPEVGGDTVAYVDPRDPQDIARVLRELLDSPERRAALGAAARERAALFTWDETARITMDVLGAVAARR